MDFIEWCSRVLDGAINAGRTAGGWQGSGISEADLTRSVFGRDAIDDQLRTRMLAAAWQLGSVGLIEQPGFLNDSRFFARVTRAGLAAAEDILPLWTRICSTSLSAPQQRLLRTVNHLSQHEDDKAPWLGTLSHNEVVAAFGQATWQDIHPLLKQLEEVGLVTCQEVPVGPGFSLGADIYATYAGLVWEHRRHLTLISQEIDRLVSEWETVSVDFKRELRTDTADNKAEFIKDIIALANTQASGKRWLIIGFDDESREYYGPPSAHLHQNHIENLLSYYTDPVIAVRYEVVDYRLGQVGRIEVFRDLKQVPYRVARDIRGRKKRIIAGQIFVRHGSQVEAPTEREQQALEAEAQRALRTAGEV